MVALRTNGYEIGNLPIVEMALDEYTSLPELNEVHPSEIERMVIGYQWRFPARNGKRVIAEVVPFEEVLCSQWGSSVLYQPKQWANRYVVQFTRSDEPSI